MELLPALQTGRLIVLCAPHAARDESAHLAAELALRGAVTVLDGGNRFLPYRVAHLLRRKTVNVAAVSNRLFVRRAFTCYEMTSLLADPHPPPSPPIFGENGGSVPKGRGGSYLILDLLNTFYDDHVPAHEADRLLKSCLGQIHRLRLSAPVVVTLAPPLAADRAFLIEQVCASADQVFTLESTPSLSPSQPSLFT
ncbi:MAG: hypothetical protein ACOYZ8_13180 [Chloroflexota bacterium]